MRSTRWSFRVPRYRCHRREATRRSRSRAQVPVVDAMGTSVGSVGGLARLVRPGGHTRSGPVVGLEFAAAAGSDRASAVDRADSRVHPRPGSCAAAPSRGPGLGWLTQDLVELVHRHEVRNHRRRRPGHWAIDCFVSTVFLSRVVALRLPEERQSPPSVRPLVGNPSPLVRDRLLECQ
jgi:hypothetical protein